MEGDDDGWGTDGGLESDTGIGQGMGGAGMGPSTAKTGRGRGKKKAKKPMGGFEVGVTGCWVKTFPCPLVVPACMAMWVCGAWWRPAARTPCSCCGAGHLARPSVPAQPFTTTGALTMPADTMTPYPAAGLAQRCRPARPHPWPGLDHQLHLRHLLRQDAAGGWVSVGQLDVCHFATRYDAWPHAY